MLPSIVEGWETDTYYIFLFGLLIVVTQNGGLIITNDVERQIVPCSDSVAVATAPLRHLDDAHLWMRHTAATAALRATAEITSYQADLVSLMERVLLDAKRRTGAGHR